MLMLLFQIVFGCLIRINDMGRLSGNYIICLVMQKMWSYGINTLNNWVMHSSVWLVDTISIVILLVERIIIQIIIFLRFV